MVVQYLRAPVPSEFFFFFIGRSFPAYVHKSIHKASISLPTTSSVVCDRFVSLFCLFLFFSP